LIAPQQPFAALRLYLNAVLRGCYRPSLAAIIFLQIFMRPAGYRRLADHVISWLNIDLSDPDDNKPARRLEQA
jgi:hypothetical protein